MKRLDLAAVRARLEQEQGRRFWRSLEELADTDELRELLEHEFPRFASVWPEGLSRRAFLSVMGASLALAGVGGCTRPPGERIVPYVRTPEQLVPGRPLYFATAMELGGVAAGLLVESHLGRPTKIEGNPLHPASGGTTDPFSQASVLTLYDPDRSRAVTELGEVRQYDTFVRALDAALERQRGQRGAGLRILTGDVASPTLAAQLEDALAAFPEARWHRHEPLDLAQNPRAGARLAFGRDVSVLPRLEHADLIVALDADFLACTPRTLPLVHGFAARRRVVRDTPPAMNRLYVVEPALSITGSKADHRLPLRAREVAPLAAALAARLGVDVGGVAATPPRAASAAWIDALARDLLAHRGRSLVLAGDAQPPVVHALAHAINDRLGNVGRTIQYTEPIAAAPADDASLATLAQDLHAGRVEMLLVLAWNPVYTAAADLDFASALARVPFTVHLGLFRDETAVRCRWHVPEAHYLEAWSDTRALDGTASIVQPLIEPLYGGWSVHELLALMRQGPATARGYEIVREHWRRVRGEDGFEAFWQRALHDGVIPGTEARPARVALRFDWASALEREPLATPEGLEIVFRGSPTVYDGRFANNGWQQELPHPITKISWDNAVLISPATAERLDLASEDVVEVVHRGRRVRGALWVMPGHADDAITLTLGYGRTLAGRVGNGVGYDAYAVRTTSAPWFDAGAELRKVGERWPLAVTSRHHAMQEREIVVTGTLAHYRDHPEFVRETAHDPHRGPGGAALTLYPEYRDPTYAWGMAIDLTACTGCNACVTACYAENNIPVVGKDQVMRGRIMHWIRVDTYFRGDRANPETYHQPMPCMHCEKAPCEVVCPVNATVHSSEGLNEMVYNRCVGTRYCSNNCPYKVRYFNFFQYADWETPSLAMQRNPDVTVRSRGVMEKCTYCVQRISAARIEAEKEGRRIRDGEVLTACQAACPTQAIVFGDLNDPTSAVHRIKKSALNYALLDRLGTRPRTTFLAALRNPNPEMPRA
jgi:molybdopterin-containing oxidoreductase family iron-sulfur binding subunit